MPEREEEELVTFLKNLAKMFQPFIEFIIKLRKKIDP